MIKWLGKIFRFGPPRTQFICNICGQTSKDVEISTISRETPSCKHCHSTVRMRSLIYGLSLHLYKKPRILSDFEKTDKISGIGMSDWLEYAKVLSEKLSYRNTFYDEAPQFDILNPKSEDFNRYDFVISSDVFEHVTPPIQRAFDNLRKIIKSNGAIIFSVPYVLSGPTIEHFPDLYDWKIVKKGDGYILENRSKEGSLTVFTDLVFHGGPGQTIELRVFSKDQLKENFENAGFKKVVILDEDVPEYGLYYPEKWSLTWIVSL
ncbi:MAG: methyltransferase domain-containing protein [Bdellovibrionales bacterium]|nr:methyltransferase domain-containing protein [Bdellovibrionales bacterium]